MKKILIPITAGLIASLGAITASADFNKINSYNGEFSDVKNDAWYAEYVSSAYELGFMKGSSQTTFEPEGNMTVAEAVTIASRIHNNFRTCRSFQRKSR